MSHTSCPYARPVEAMTDPYIASGARVAIPSRQPQRRRQQLQHRQSEEEELTTVVFSANILDAGAQPKEEKTQELRYRSAEELYNQLERLHLHRKISAEQAMEAVLSRTMAPEPLTPRRCNKSVTFAPSANEWSKPQALRPPLHPMPMANRCSSINRRAMTAPRDEKITNGHSQGKPMLSKQRECDVLSRPEPISCARPEPYSVSKLSRMKHHIGLYNQERHAKSDDTQTVSTVDDTDHSETFALNSNAKNQQGQPSKRTWIRKLFRRREGARLP